MLYIGSCRYMYGYKWISFPARLHTTKEIIYFLENIDNLQNVINNIPSDLINNVFGDIYHPAVIKDSNNFINNPIDKKNIKKIILEICSKKILFFNNIPINFFYTNNYLKNKYSLVEYDLGNDDIEKDLDYIVNISKKIFSENIEIHIIPHLNLKLKSNNEYLSSRNELVNLLEYLCNKKNIYVHNIGKYLENITNNTIFLEDYMQDGKHYSKDYEKVYQYLINKIY